jgi:hypothetical protein
VTAKDMNVRFLSSILSIHAEHDGRFSFETPLTCVVEISIESLERLTLGLGSNGKNL